MRTLVLSLGVLLSSDNPLRSPHVAMAARSYAARSCDHAGRTTRP
jgi:hypothetical protein